MNIVFCRTASQHKKLEQRELRHRSTLQSIDFLTFSFFAILFDILADLQDQAG